jgi:hypothetical protein
MPALMRYRLVLLLLLVAFPGVLLGACGKEIGDACVFSSDCSPNGDRQCIDANQSGGYCSIQGCDYSTCPDEAACIRFFNGSFSNRPCDPTKLPAACVADSTNCCSLDELCGISNNETGGNCVPRSSEVRYCMRTCDSDDDCRDGYECRDLGKMKAHGGEPVLAPAKDENGQPIPAPIDDKAPKFCALAPR